MAEISWIKLKIDMFDDEKIKLIQCMPEGDSILVIWIRLIALAGKCNAGGYILIEDDFPYNEEMLASIFNKSIQIIKLAIQTFERFGMVEITTKGIYITNFNKHQNIEGMERIREQNRIRKQRQREKQKALLLENKVICHVTGHGTVTGSHATDKEEDIEIDKDIYIYSSNEEYKPIPSETETEDDTNIKQERINYNRILNDYNRICKDLPKVRAISDERKRKIKTLMNALNKAKLLTDKDTYERLEHIFQLADESDFLSGRKQPNRWCGFDWLIKSTNAFKVIEGNYKNKGGETYAKPGEDNNGLDASDEAEQAAIRAFRNRNKDQ